MAGSLMSRKNIFLLLFAAALAVVYAVWFSDWFAPRAFTVFHTFRAARMRPGLARRVPEPSLTFVASRWLKITEIRVVPLAVWTTNKSALPLWHLVSESNSIPLKNFVYGQPIPGLHPALKGTRAEFPQTNVTYRLIVTAGKDTAEHDFELK
jgi:hypothetical protein